MAELSKVYFFKAGADGHESEPAEIGLKPDGSADLSRLPDDLSVQLEVFGVRNVTHSKQVMPKEGEHFLECLLDATNQAWRFRTSPDKKGRI